MDPPPGQSNGWFVAKQQFVFLTRSIASDKYTKAIGDSVFTQNCHCVYWAMSPRTETQS